MNPRSRRRVRAAISSVLCAVVMASWSSGSRAQAATPVENRREHAIVILTESFGVPNDLALALTERVRQVTARVGYVALGPDVTRPALAALPPQTSAMTPARLLEITRRLGAERGIVLSVRQLATGQFELEVHVASGDGAGPWSARGSGAGPSLPALAEQLVVTALPPPAAVRIPVTPPADPAVSPPRRPIAEPNDLHGWRLAIATEAAFGLSGSSFYNHLAGARLDHRFTRQVSAGAYVGYVNLKGKAGRAHNVLPYALLEWRPSIAGSFSLPLRYAMGYLPKNGPVIRLSAGLGWALSDSVELTVEPVTPMLWVTHDETVFSLDLAAELGFTFD